MVGDRTVTKEELMLLMDSYKAVIESNLNLIAGQESLRNLMKENYNSVSEKTNKILGEILKELDDHHKDCRDERATNIKDMKEAMSNSQKNTDQAHYKQNIKVFGILALMTSAIIALIGLIYRLWPSVPTP